MSPEQSRSCRAPRRPGVTRVRSPRPRAAPGPALGSGEWPGPWALRELSALRPLARDSGLTPASRPHLYWSLLNEPIENESHSAVVWLDTALQTYTIHCY